MSLLTYVVYHEIFEHIKFVTVHVYYQVQLQIK